MTYSHMHARRPISQHLLVVAVATVAAATASAVAAAAGCRQEATTNERASERAARARNGDWSRRKIARRYRHAVADTCATDATKGHRAIFLSFSPENLQIRLVLHVFLFCDRCNYRSTSPKSRSGTHVVRRTRAVDLIRFRRALNIKAKNLYIEKPEFFRI